MQRLIIDLLAFSRVGTRERTLEWTDMSKVLESTLENLKVGIREAGALITNDPLPKLNVDPTQMAQLFQNLIGNAIKFRSNQTPEIHIGATHRLKTWLFSIKDNGIGIDPQYTERIFMIFQRLHTRRKYPGRESGWQSVRRSSNVTGGKSGWNPSRKRIHFLFYYS